MTTPQKYIYSHEHDSVAIILRCGSVNAKAEINRFDVERIRVLLKTPFEHEYRKQGVTLALVPIDTWFHIVSDSDGDESITISSEQGQNEQDASARIVTRAQLGELRANGIYDNVVEDIDPDEPVFTAFGEHEMD